MNFFQLPVPLLFKNTATGQQKLVTLHNVSNGQVFTDNLGFVPDVVIFDPEKWLVTRNNTLTKASDPLPVTFKTFSVSCEGSQPKLHWATSQETSADYFKIQRSYDAYNWSAAGTVKASGNSTDLKNYTFTDQTLTARNAYYRIAEFDFDGTEQHSRILYAQCQMSENQALTVSPNPVRDDLHFEIHSDNKALLRVQIFNVQGELMQSGSFSSSTEKRISVANLAAGLYILQVENAETKVVLKTRFLKE